MGGSAVAGAHCWFLKCCHQKAGRATLPRVHEAMGLEAILKLHANMLTWHFDSAINEGVGIKETGTLGNDSIKEAVKCVIRQIE